MNHITEKIVNGLGTYNDEFKGKTVLITGSHGFLGGHLRRYFSALPNTRVICLDNFITGNTEPALKNQINIQSDVIKPIKIKDKVDYIFHFSSIASPFYYRKYPLQCFETNIIGTKNILELARKKKVKSVLYASSSEIYGDALQIPTMESYRGNVACLGPRATYDESKRAAEALCEIYHNQYGTPVKIVRPFNFYSEGMNQNDFRVLPNFASKILKGEALQVYGDGTQTRTMTYASDGIEGCIRALLLGVNGQPYNICASEGEISMYDLAVLIGEIANRKVGIELTPYPDSYPADEPMRRIGDITKAKIQLGFNPKVSAKEGIKYFVDWALENYK